MWRQAGQRYLPMNTVARSSSRISVMFWGCISGNGGKVLLKTPQKCTSADYVKILKDAGIDTLEESQFFQDDNAPIHRSSLVIEFFESHGIAKEDWPPYSPDLNPIENVWAYMKRQMRSMDVTPENLETTVFDIWNKIPAQFVENLYHSMPGRVSRCFSGRGFPIAY